MSADNYDILNILGHSINSSSYKVKDRKTGQTLAWRVVDYENKSNSNKEHMLDHIKKQIEMSHPNIIKFHDIIDQEENKILYIVTEYCENGSIKDVIETCLANNTYFSEELVCKILYQIAFAIKTADNFIGKLCIKEIFLDEDFNIKLFNFKLNNDILKEAKMSHLGLILYEICTFKTFTKSTYEIELKQMEKIYSHSLLSLITSLVEDRAELRKNISEVLCHPTVLLRSTQWLKENCFVNSRQSEKCISLQKDINYKDGSKLYTLKLEKLRKKEASLQVREQQLNEREYKLMLKEKKIALMDRAAKEKLQQAELYLKRCREPKSVSSESSKSTRKEKKTYENLDATYVSCGDSILLPTSSKLNVNKIIKPTSFTRTLSERRIRFKGHSPLKEIDFNKRNTRQSKLKKAFFRKNDSGWLTCSEDNDKSSIEGNTKAKRCNKAKQLFSDKNTYQNDILISSDMQYKSITWTEENKKHAFELLRMMNDDKENQGLQVKHTYL
ncbi:serine/threonine-protein kinase Nek2-like [Anoplophora glabripennis]|uniref:serine/threonine-protein kinase Nek2-like n=1 Tax=Anoplophora glabripennis TaxID=217634 RepID=UPI0008750EDB|nr:serine/threonine-protein kinase Nek2-like [Anoplophora glabripennis]